MKHDQENYEQLQLSARRMRAIPTQAENALWRALRDRKLGGLKFRRQKVIGPFIADFYCASARLVIEVDGDIHTYQKDEDVVRTRQFEDYGYQVIRFSNEMVQNNLDEALSEIKRIASLTPTPSPNTGRGEQAPVSYPQSDCAESPADSEDVDAPLPLGSGEGAGG